VRLKSSTARPSSAPEALKSVQRIQSVAPAGTEIEEIVAARLAVAGGTTAPTVVVKGDEKSRASTSVHVPVARLVASRLYWKSSRSAPRPAVPSRYCSPVYDTSSDVIAAPVLLRNAAPIDGMSVPL